MATMFLALTVVSGYGLDSDAAYKSAGSQALIEESYQSGQISLGDKIFYSIQALYDEQSLPAGLKSDSPELIKSGTELILEAYQNWDILSPEQQNKVSDYTTRQPLDTFCISPENYFIIHYDTIGTQAVPLEDLDIDGIPDYAERVGIYADSAYRHYHNNLEYYPPPLEPGELYEIYLLKLGAYGVTVPEVPGDSSWNDFTSHMEIHCNFEGPMFGPNDDPEGKVIGAQKVTCAHEYYHAVQFAYDFDYGNRWWMECTAVFFEDVLYPEVNDNYNYLDLFFDFPDTFLIIDNSHMYGTFIWASYLVDNYGFDLLRSSFEYIRYYPMMNAIDTALGFFDVNIKRVFPEFTIWNYFTADRASSIFYADAADYPPVVFDQTVSDFPLAVVEPIKGPDGLGSNYVMCYPDVEQEAFFMFRFQGSQLATWGLSYIIYENGSDIEYTEALVDDYARSKWGIYDFAVMDSMVVIPCVISQYNDDNNYQLYVDTYQYGDVDYSGDLNILDVVHLINYKYKDGSEPDYDIRMGDTDCDGDINIIDIVYLISSIYKNGPLPGPCRD